MYEHINSKGVKYYLNTKDVTMNGGRVQLIFFFSKDPREETGCLLPNGYEVVESSRTGLPIVRRAK